MNFHYSKHKLKAFCLLYHSIAVTFTRYCHAIITVCILAIEAQTKVKVQIGVLSSSLLKVFPHSAPYAISVISATLLLIVLLLLLLLLPSA